MTPVADTNTRMRVLDAAERLVQERGFNGFSYAHVAGELGITKASLHYHFAGKADLGRALIDRYVARFSHQLDEIDTSSPDAPSKLAGYVRLYERVLIDEGRICLCGMLAADYRTLPAAMREAVTAFFEENEAWLLDVLTDGEAAGQLHLTGSPRVVAQAIVGGLEGAMLLARPYGDGLRFRAVAVGLIRGLTGTVLDLAAPVRRPRTEAAS
ncbi:MAG TPA: TetR/AcrR family transcriptional regulator [Mycobacteriales bacterium]|nr:TetR/AcrR family transcriptional regulator [Mycobacteriales bacterium]